MKFSVYNLGCRVNLAELEKITDDLIARGYTYANHVSQASNASNGSQLLSDSENEPVEIAIINTCTVTAQADKKSWRAIRLLAETATLEFLFITGCYSELNLDLSKQLDKYAIKYVIVSQRDKNKLAEIVENTVSLAYGYTYEAHREEYRNKFEAFKRSRSYVGALLSSQERFYGHHRAILKIQDGCNEFCTYCRIPYARGAPLSRPRDDILEQIKKLGENGVAEIVLTGINLSAYQDKHSRTSFSKLLSLCLSRAAEMGGDVKIRLSSLEPHGLDDDFFKLLSHPNLVPHLHLPLQGTSERILKAMKRRYTLKEYKKIIERIYTINPYFAITTDVITGYPSETEAEFLEGLDFLRTCEFLKLHVFPFSYRPLSALDSETGQELLKTSEIPLHEKKYRAERLRKLSHTLEQTKLQMFQSIPQRFVLETSLNETDTQDFFTTHFKDTNLEGAHIYTGTSEYYLKGKLIVPKRQDLSLGKAVEVKLIQTSPPLFALSGASA